MRHIENAGTYRPPDGDAPNDWTAEVAPGSVVFIPAGEPHTFTEITDDLALVVVFAPPYGSRTIPDGPR